MESSLFCASAPRGRGPILAFDMKPTALQAHYSGDLLDHHTANLHPLRSDDEEEEKDCETTSIAQQIPGENNAESIVKSHGCAGEMNDSRTPPSVQQRERVEELLRQAEIHPDQKNDMKLRGEWCFWIDSNVKKGVSEDRFLDSLQCLGTITHMNGLANVVLARCQDLLHIDQDTEKCNIRLFRKDIAPTREDPANVLGGQYVVYLSLDRDGVQRLWLRAIVALVKERFELKGLVIGLVLALKRRVDTLAIWMDRGCHPMGYAQQKEHICNVLGLPTTTKIKYNNHNNTRGRGINRGSAPQPLDGSVSLPAGALLCPERSRSRAFSQPIRVQGNGYLPKASSWTESRTSIDSAANGMSPLNPSEKSAASANNRFWSASSIRSPSVLAPGHAAQLLQGSDRSTAQPLHRSDWLLGKRLRAMSLGAPMKPVSTNNQSQPNQPHVTTATPGPMGGKTSTCLFGRSRANTTSHPTRTDRPHAAPVAAKMAL